LAIVLSVLWYTDYDCPFGIFKLFLQSGSTGESLGTSYHRAKQLTL
jgi:hypothetical protein